jgi:dolichyl-phosphate beta-glucosyltransferase
VGGGWGAPEGAQVGLWAAAGPTARAALAVAARLVVNGHDVAIASRAVTGSVTQVRHSRLRERGAGAYRSLTDRLVPGVRDTQCGFKVFAGDSGRRVFADLRTTGFSFDVELLARCQLAGLSIAEFPAVWTDVPGSTFNPARHGVRSFLDLATIAWRLRGAPTARRAVIAFPVPQAGSPLAAPALGGAVTNAEV